MCVCGGRGRGVSNGYVNCIGSRGNIPYVYLNDGMTTDLGHDIKTSRISYVRVYFVLSLRKINTNPVHPISI